MVSDFDLRPDFETLFSAKDKCQNMILEKVMLLINTARCHVVFLPNIFRIASKVMTSFNYLRR